MLWFGIKKGLYLACMNPVPAIFIFVKGLLEDLMNRV